MIAQEEIVYALYEHEQKQLESEPAQKNNQIKVASKDENPSDDQQSAYKIQIAWKSVARLIVLHAFALYGLTQLGRVSTTTILFTIVLMLLTSMGVQVGVHRLWSHRSFKANFGVRVFLAFCQTLSLQNDIYEWARDHRAHHKFSETDADPHNSKRGFFFSHVGWLMVKKHPEVFRRGKTVDLSDLLADPIVRFQRRFYLPLVLLIWGFLPTVIPVYFWGESLWRSFLVCLALRYAYSLNSTWLVNSWCHMYGSRPYDKGIAPVEASIRHVILGEGFHNYHHAFPWDYSASELGPSDVFNLSTAVIDFFALFGWVWDRKKVNSKMVAAKM
ncbi:PREDICTED: stearoyl-CoA desaturase 5-like, partial [Rhagoletis zephyria]|uniref:stearoyl-CoA desaturase 5-like n=1 Tax=Rhagoletis zephyria TaxID=28612 RepID=UPI00081125B7